MSVRSLLFVPAALSALALAGCGSSGPVTSASSPSSPPAPLPVVGGSVPLNSTTSTAKSTLQAYEIDPANGYAVSGQRGALDRSTNAVTLGTLTGTMDPTRAFIALAPGGQASLFYGKNASYNYVAGYGSNAASGDQTIGVLGVPTAAGQVPASGSATYSGDSTVGITDASASYTLTGASSTTVNFGTATVNSKLSGLSGTETNGSGVSSPVSNVAVVTINGAKLVNGAFSGGTATIPTSTLSTGLSGNQTVTNTGALYGPNGVEIGGVFVIDDQKSSSLLLEGSYLGKQ